MTYGAGSRVKKKPFGELKSLSLGLHVGEEGKVETWEFSLVSSISN